jgi:hypothetical protein
MAELTFNPSQNNRLYVDTASELGWAGTRDAANSVGLQAGVYSYAVKDGTQYGISRIGLSFDTSSIPDNATISAAVIKIYPTIVTDTDSVNIFVVSFAPVDPAAHAVGDYAKAKWGTTSWGTITHATLGANLNALNSITLNASGIANISKTGTCSFGLRNSRDAEDSAPAGANRVDMTAANTVLVVTYSLPATAGFFTLL